MAVIKKRVDDYLYNSKGEEVQEARQVAIHVPGLAFGGTRAKKHTLDVSTKGEKAMNKERARLEEATRKLWAPFLKNINFTVPSTDAPDEALDADESEDETALVEEALPGTDEEYESPSHSAALADDQTYEEMEAATTRVDPSY